MREVRGRRRYTDRCATADCLQAEAGARGKEAADGWGAESRRGKRRDDRAAGGDRGTTVALTCRSAGERSTGATGIRGGGGAAAKRPEPEGPGSLGRNRLSPGERPPDPPDGPWTRGDRANGDARAGRKLGQQPERSRGSFPRDRRGRDGCLGAKRTRRAQAAKATQSTKPDDDSWKFPPGAKNILANIRQELAEQAKIFIEIKFRRINAHHVIPPASHSSPADAASTTPTPKANADPFRAARVKPATAQTAKVRASAVTSGAPHDERPTPPARGESRKSLAAPGEGGAADGYHRRRAIVGGSRASRRLRRHHRRAGHAAAGVADGAPADRSAHPCERRRSGRRAHMVEGRRPPSDGRGDLPRRARPRPHRAQEGEGAARRDHRDWPSVTKASPPCGARQRSGFARSSAGRPPDLAKAAGR